MDDGTRLGPYEIRGKLGEGGMGEVYLGEDTRLGRKVAIKVLPAEFAGDPERLARFEQEARAAAALNHPHIAAVFDVGFEEATTGTGAADSEVDAGDSAAASSDATGADAAAAGGIHYMVQEYLAGETLRERLDRGRLPLGEALDLAVEIGEALGTAHRAGIVHRDLKPENVFVTDGHAKVLDFGLAKLTEVGAVGDRSASMSPTVLGTVAGQVMGTAGYMAPEQVNGEAVDGRTDLFAFGCLLYEMVTGERAFAGENVHETLSRILSRDPVPLIERRADLPLTLGWIVDKALAKDAGRRYQTAADAVVDLERLREEIAAGTATPARPDLTASEDRGERADAAPPPTGLPLATTAAAVLGLLAVAVGATWWLSRPVADPPASVQRFDLEITPASSFTNLNNRPVAISPDGRSIVVVADENDTVGHLWLRSLDGLDLVRLRNTVEPREPAFSPDSRELVFWSEPDEIVRMPATGGGPVSVAALEERPYGISWGDDGNIWVGRGGQGVWRVPATGGDLEQIVAVDDGESAYGPRLLADGESVLFTLRRAGARWDEADIVVWSPGDEQPRVLLQGGRDARITSSGHLVYVSDNVLMARAIDLATLEITGGAVAMVDPVPTSGGDLMGAASYDLSETGTLVWTTGAAFAGEVALAWADRETGSVERLPVEPGRFSSWRLSPDGRRIATQRDEEALTEIWIYDVDRAAGQRLSAPGIDAGAPVWSHDGEWVYFDSDDGSGDLEIQRRRADFSGDAEVVVASTDQDLAFLWPADTSRDGEWLLYVSFIEGTRGADVVRLALADDEPAREVVLTADSVEDARFSPDGRRVAFSTMGDNTWEVYVQEIASGARTLVSVAGGRYPAWSPDGTDIYYFRGGMQFVATVHTEPRLRVDNPEPVYPEPLTLAARQEPSPDGGRLLVGVFEGGDGIFSDARVFVTLHWFEALRRRAVPSR